MPARPLPVSAALLRHIADELDAAAGREATTRDLLSRLRAYLRTDGEALAPQAAALASEIDGLLGTD